MKDIDYHPENCKIYTPEDIAKTMIKELRIKWNENIKILEPAVGTGNIFIPLLEKFLKHYKNASKEEISIKMRNTFWVFDIDQSSILELKKNIIKICRKYNFEYDNEIKIADMNILTEEIKEDFDYIIGNPPYISKKNLREEQRESLKGSNTCSKYNYDMYFYFFEKCISLLKENGTLVFITPNSYLNSISGLELRKEIIYNTTLKKIINFPNKNIFKDALVKVCITKLVKKKNYKLNKYKYHYLEKDDNEYLKNIKLSINIDNFLLSNTSSKREGEKLEDLFYISGGIATLNDKFFIIKEKEVVEETKEFITIKKENVEYKIEKDLIRNVMRPRMGQVIDKIIYPYIKDTQKIEEDEIKKKYPEYYNYFKGCSLSKGLYYGRSQGLRYLENQKIVFPKISSRFKPYKSIDELIISGIYFVPLNEKAKSLIPIIENNYSKILEEIKYYCKNHGSDIYTINTTVLKKLLIDNII